MFPSQKYRAGQSSLEYLALAVFVMMGIIIGGPYVVRGINAHFKTLEEGALDSEREKITQGIYVNGEKGLPDCQCTPLTDHGCADGVIRDDTGVVCSRRQKVFKRKCNVLGCEVDIKAIDHSYHMIECQNDPDAVCCDPASVSQCGNADGPTGYCFSATGSQRYERKMCGSPTAVIKESCSYDASCTYSCQPLDDPHSAWCNEAVQNVYLISPDVPVLYRNPGACTGDIKCEAQCIAPYVTDPRYNEDGKHCCGGGVGGIIMNGGPYATAMQSDSFDADGPDCIATPNDSKITSPLESQVYQTINYIMSHAGISSTLTSQNQTDVYAVGGKDSYWSPDVAGDVFFAVVSYNLGVSFGVYDIADPSGGVMLLTSPEGGSVNYTGDGTLANPYSGGKFTASGTPMGFIFERKDVVKFYSDPTLNISGALDAMVSFQLPGLAGKTIWINTPSGSIPMPLTADTYLLGFEWNLASSSDLDYNDACILVTKIKPVP